MLKKLFLYTLFFSFLTNISATKLDSLMNVSSLFEKDTNQVNTFNQIAEIHLEEDYLKAIFYAKKALTLSNELGFISGKISSYLTLIDANNYLGRYSETQKVNFELLEIYKKKHDKSGIASSYNNIGIVHYYLSNLDLAAVFTNKALNIYIELKDTSGMSMCYNNLANVYSDKEEYKNSLKFYLKALEIDEKSGNMEWESLVKGNIGEVYTSLQDYDNAYKYLFEALALSEKDKDLYQQANMQSAIALLLIEQNKNDDALHFLFLSLELSKKLNLLTEYGELYEAVSEAYQQKGNFKKSLEYLQLSVDANLDIYSKENADKIAEMNAFYEMKEKEKELEQQHKLSKIESKQKTYVMIGSAIGFALLLIIVAVFAKGNSDKRKINKKLEFQNLEIETKSQSITDSIVYAKRIQGAILPSENTINKLLKNNFIYYKPKDIVAGDFYWMESIVSDNNEECVLFAAADCTGHGVPGAMVSVVCNNALNRAVREFKLKEPAKILDKITELVIETFEQSEANIKDGMDIALCRLNTKTNELEYAGANNSLYLVRNNELSEIKSDKQPIGKFTNTVAFTNHKISLKKDDAIYLFTDGYADQFGGIKGKKFKYKQFRELLLTNCNLKMDQQLERLNFTFNNWKGDLEQIDDVCVIGVKI